MLNNENTDILAIDLSNCQILTYDWYRWLIRIKNNCNSLARVNDCKIADSCKCNCQTRSLTLIFIKSVNSRNQPYKQFTSVDCLQMQYYKRLTVDVSSCQILTYNWVSNVQRLETSAMCEHTLKLLWYFNYICQLFIIIKLQKRHQLSNFDMWLDKLRERIRN